MKYYSWGEVESLATSVAKQLSSNQPFDVIVSILRGGGLVSVLLSHHLGCSVLGGLQIRSHIDEKPRSERNKSQVLHGLEKQIIQDKNILLVDDVVNSGESMKAAISYLEEYENKSITACALVWDTYGLENKFSPPIDSLVYGEKIDAWVNFPWEYDRIKA